MPRVGLVLIGAVSKACAEAVYLEGVATSGAATLRRSPPELTCSRVSLR